MQRKSNKKRAIETLLYHSKLSYHKVGESVGAGYEPVDNDRKRDKFIHLQTLVGSSENPMNRFTHL